MLIYVAIGLLLGVLVLVALGKRKKPGPPAESRHRTDTQLGMAPTLATQKPQVQALLMGQAPAPGPGLARPLPPALQGVRFTRYEELPAPQTSALLGRLQTIPRPPNALDKLVSAEFLSHATSAELNDLMVGEPQIAAKVLASVNSPLYGLQRPLHSIGQAATYLGMNTVRGICMQYLLDASFQATSPEVKASYTSLWNSSAFSSELCFKLAQLLGLPEPGSLVTHVVLSYLGPLATYSILSPETLLAHSRLPVLDKALAEQQSLGLCGAEMGALLMHSWNLPAALVADVRAIDRVLVEPAKAPVRENSARLALCYLCNYLGAHLANASLPNLDDFELTCDALELHYLPSYLAHPSLQRLPEFLQFPEVLSAASHMATTAKLPRQGTLH